MALFSLDDSSEAVRFYERGLRSIVRASPGKLVSVIFSLFCGVRLGSARVVEVEECSDPLAPFGCVRGIRIRGWMAWVSCWRVWSRSGLDGLIGAMRIWVCDSKSNWAGESFVERWPR